MKSKSNLIMLGAFCLSLLICTSTALAKDKVYNFKYVGVYPPFAREWIDKYVEIVEKYTSGRIKLKAFACDEIFPSPENLNATKNNVVQICTTIPAMHTPPITTGVAMSSPILGLASDMEAMAFRETFKGGRAFEIMREEFAENGVHVIGSNYAGALALLAKKPVQTIADLKGLKPESLVPDIAVFLKNLGVASQFVPDEEIYMAMSTGTINAATIGGPSVYHNEIKLDELAHYLHKPYLIYGASPVTIINLKVWNSLPDDLKLALEAATKVYAKWEAESQYIKDIIAEREGGFEIVEFDDELKKKMWAAAVKSWDDAAALSPRSAEIIELLKEWNRLHGRID